MPINDDGSADPPFERKDLNMRNLHRARGERLSARAHTGTVKRVGQEEESGRTRRKTRMQSR
jgi:hypothetical protein